MFSLLLKDLISDFYDTFAFYLETLLIMTLVQKCSQWESINYQSSDSLLYPLLLSLGMILWHTVGQGPAVLAAGVRRLG